MKEIEIVQYTAISGLVMYFDCVNYRTPHQHREFEMMWIIDNPIRITCGGESFTAEKGEITILNPGLVHEFYAKEGCTFLCIQVRPELWGLSSNLTETRFDSRLLSRSFTPEEMQELRELLTKAAAAYYSREEGCELYAISRMGDVFYRLLKKLPHHRMTLRESADLEKRSALIDRMLNYVDEHYAEKIRLTDFAEQEALSMSYLSHIIKETLNQGFRSYVETVRLNAASEMMLDMDRKLLDICYSAGFSDYRYFSSAFKKRFKMTPENYRNTVSVRRSDEHMLRSLHSMEKFLTEEETKELLRALAAENERAKTSNK
ncbi:MAG: helix-turn-helix transcriptional regulator [Lachnospiraceae bacterium]|nr:helix-turn-helix transcriptional regulator [Lachnospiraceae bacterium]MBR7016271.1 helix-turn-helix transcriptional regulator [Lachnospiraceae bacterium]